MENQNFVDNRIKSFEFAPCYQCGHKLSECYCPKSYDSDTGETDPCYCYSKGFHEGFDKGLKTKIESCDVLPFYEEQLIKIHSICQDELESKFKTDLATRILDVLAKNNGENWNQNVKEECACACHREIEPNPQDIHCARCINKQNIDNKPEFYISKDGLECTSQEVCKIAQYLNENEFIGGYTEMQLQKDMDFARFIDELITRANKKKNKQII